MNHEDKSTIVLSKTPVDDDNDDLNEEAKRRFPFFQDIVLGYKLHQQSALQNHHLTPNGRYLVLTELKDMLGTCKQVLNYTATSAADKMFLPRPVVDRPLIMCGLPRTGSTLLYNLLACDPHCRAPFATDMFKDCVPPVPRTDKAEHQRRAATIQAFKQRREELTGIVSKQSASHPIFPVEEDFLIFRHIGVFTVCHIKTFDQDFESEKWLYDETNKNFVYEYHKLFFRMLNAVDEPQSHWLLKGIMHCLYLDTLLDHYPQAFLLMTHRSLPDIIPSFCRFIWEAYRFCFDPNDAANEKLVTKITYEMIDTMIKRLVKFRRSSRHAHLESYKTICDVDYDDLIREPIETVRRIYQHFGFSYSPEFEAAMRQWLKDNPQGKQGRNPYNLADMGLTAADIDQTYIDYIDMFFCKKKNEGKEI